MNSAEPENREEERREAELEALLRGAERGAMPPEAVEREVRAAVRAEWARVVRARRLRTIWIGSAAAAIVAAAALWLAMPPARQAATEQVAVVERVTGSALYSTDASQWNPAAETQALHVGDQVRTGPGDRVALRLDANTTVRLDESTLVTFDRPEAITLAQGAAYVDALPRAAAASPLLIDTVLGSVRHVGTQYEVRVAGDALRISVREGTVELDRGSTPVQAQAGEQLAVAGSGELDRRRIAPDDPAWNWIATVVPAYRIEGRPLGEFLNWAARELGIELEFATPETEHEAARVTLHGSIEGLAPDTALKVVLSTTRLRHTQNAGRLYVELPPEG